jgi:RND family efflux transporter MFP subunit
MKKVFVLLSVGLMFMSSTCRHEKTVETVKTVKVDTVRVYGEKPGVTFPGKVKAAADVNLSFRISGPVSKVYVNVGTHVKKGQVVAEIDSRDYALQLSATEAEYNRIKSEAERIFALYEKKSVTPNDYDKAVYGLNQISAKYDAHKNALTDTKLRAPFEGYVQKKFFDAGETVGAGMPVISMIGTNSPEVEISIPSSDFIRREQFESFACTVDIYPDSAFPLELVGIAQKANLNQLYTMRLKIKDGAKPQLIPGMTAMVTIRLKPEKTARVCIPLSAMFEIRNTPSVWVYNSDTQTVEARNISPDEILSDGTVVVSEGLNEGEIIVTAGVHALRQNEKVKLLPAVSPSNTGGLL